MTNQSFSYDPDDRLESDTYDANGNTLTSAGSTFGYDFEDRPTTFNGGNVTMIYDGDGNRIVRTADGTASRYLIDDQTPLHHAQVAEEVVAGTVVAQYTYGPMRISQNRAGTVSYYGYDGGGSVRQLFDASGAITDTYTYDAYGNTVAQNGTTVNSFLYRGEQFDTTLGMYYQRARYYIPRTGRFLTADTFAPKQFGGCPQIAPGLPLELTTFMFSGTPILSIKSTRAGAGLLLLD